MKKGGEGWGAMIKHFEWKRLYILILAALACVSAGAYQGPKLPEPTEEVAALIARASQLVADHKVTEALGVLDSAATKAITAGDLLGKAMVLRSEALIYTNDGQVAKSLACWQGAAEAWSGANQPDWKIEAVGHLLAASPENSPEAKTHLQTILDLMGSAAKDRTSLARQARDVADRLAQQYWLTEAREIVNPAVKMLEMDGGSSRALGQAYATAGEIALEAGDLATSEHFLRLNLSIYQSLLPQSLDLAETYQRLGIIAYSRSDFNLSKWWLGKATHLQDNHNAVYNDSEVGSYEPGATNDLLGLIAFYNDQDLAQASRQFQAAVTAYESETPPNLSNAAGAYDNLELIAYRQGDLALAEHYLRQSYRALTQAVPNSPLLAITCRNLADLLRRRGNPTEARKYFEEALSIQTVKAPNSIDLALTEIWFADLENGEHHWDQAVSLLTAASQIVQLQLADPASLDSQELLELPSQQYVPPLAIAYVGAGQPERAFEAINQRGEALRRWIGARGVDAFSAATPDQKAQRNMLLQQMADDRSRLEATTDPQEVEQLRTKVFSATAEIRQIENDILRAHPESVRFAPLDTIDVPRAQSILPPGTLLMQYLVADDQVLLFTLTNQPGSLKVHVIPIGRDALTQLCRGFRLAIGNRLSYFELGRTLYDLLVAPAGEEIEGCQRILLCPDDALDLLPFSALVKRAKGAKVRPLPEVVADQARGDHTPPVSSATVEGDVVYLADERPIHTVVSLGVYDQLQKAPPSQAPVPFLGFGDPDYQGALPDLKESLSEVQDAASTLGGQAIVGTLANRDAVIRMAGQARILHLACHSKIDPKDPAACGLMLANVGGKPDVLQAFQIAQLRLNSDLVTLSACETGLGGVTSSVEGVDGLVRAFELAGARSILVSLWSVADKSTSELMRAFYHHLKDGESKDEALRESELETRKTYPHPYYWAPFVLNGDYR